MSRAGQMPYTWAEIEEQVRISIVRMASNLSTFGPQDGDQTVTAFLGMEVEIPGEQEMSEEEIAAIDLGRHGLHRMAKASYHYAYQLDGREDYTAEMAYEAAGLLGGAYAFCDFHGEPTGIDPRNDMALRRVIETAKVRWNMTHEDHDITVRGLSLLTGMAEPTVRSTLSKEGFRLRPGIGRDKEDKASYTLPSHEAQQWLGRRRSYIPNRDDPSPERTLLAVRDALADRDVPFPTALARAAELSNLDLPGAPGVDLDWYRTLVEGGAASPDVAALSALADALGAPRALVAGRGVEHILGLETEAA